MEKVSNKEKVDIVITWVDGSDEEWQLSKQKYISSSCNSEGINNARFRDWDNLKYVFRSIQENLDWINKVFFVTCGHYPTWLNKNCEKLVLISHKDFIPSEYLPTFSSHTIELNLHRIPNLGDKFIYMNDDIFILNKMNINEFFVNGLPCDSNILNVHCVKKNLIIHNIACNDVSIINNYFDINKRNLYSFKYGLKNNIQNFILSSCPRYPGFKQFHMANSYLKSTFEEVWKNEYDILNATCLNKFRTINDVNQWIMREWQLASGNFYPVSKHKYGVMIDFEKENLNNCLQLCKKNLLHSSKLKMICINDGDTIDNFEYIKQEINKMLEEKFPNKSIYEK